MCLVRAYVDVRTTCTYAHMHIHIYVCIYTCHMKLCTYLDMYVHTLYEFMNIITCIVCTFKYTYIQKTM